MDAELEPFLYNNVYVLTTAQVALLLGVDVVVLGKHTNKYKAILKENRDYFLVRGPKFKQLKKDNENHPFFIRRGKRIHRSRLWTEEGLMLLVTRLGRLD